MRKTGTVLLTIMIAVAMVSVIAIAEESKPIDWQKKYLETQVELDRTKAVLQNTAEELIWYKRLYEYIKDDRIRKASAISQKTLTEYIKTTKPDDAEKK